MIAYNLMSIYRMFVLQEKTQKTLRYRVFAIGAYFTKVKDRLVLNIALHKKTTALVQRFVGLQHQFPSRIF